MREFSGGLNPRLRNEGEGEIGGSPRREPFPGAAHRRPIRRHAVAGFE